MARSARTIMGLSRTPILLLIPAPIGTGAEVRRQRRRRRPTRCVAALAADDGGADDAPVDGDAMRGAKGGDLRRRQRRLADSRTTHRSRRSPSGRRSPVRMRKGSRTGIA
jgi:hypothetical protein